MLHGRNAGSAEPLSIEQLMAELKHIIIYCKLNDYAIEVLHEAINMLSERKYEGIGIVK